MGLLARFQVFPHESHVVAVKRIFKYIQGIIDYGTWYDKIEEFNLKPCIDADWDGSLCDRKTNSGATFFLGNACCHGLVRNERPFLCRLLK